MMQGNLTKSALIILDELAIEGPMSPKQIAKKSKLPLRTVSFALRRLLGYRLCTKIPNLLDMRQPLYHVDRDRVKDMWTHIERIRVEYGVRMRAF